MEAAAKENKRLDTLGEKSSQLSSRGINLLSGAGYLENARKMLDKIPNKNKNKDKDEDQEGRP